MGQAAKVTRENRTITVDFHDETTYVGLLGNSHAFVEFVRFCRKFSSEVMCGMLSFDDQR